MVTDVDTWDEAVVDTIMVGDVVADTTTAGRVAGIVAGANL